MSEVPDNPWVIHVDRAKLHKNFEFHEIEIER